MAESNTKVNTFKFRWAYVQDLAFLIYLCAATANQTGVGFDALFVRLSFVVYFATIVPTAFVRVRITSYFKWLLLFYSYIALSCLWGDPDFSGHYFNQFVQILVIVFGLTQRIKTVEDVKRYVLIYYLTMIYFVALLYYRTPAAVWGTDVIGEEIGHNRNGVGLHSATGFILSLYFVLGTRWRFTRIVNIVLMVIFAIVAINSTSRKGFMMVPIGLALYWLFYEKRTMSQYRSMIRGFIGFIVVFTMILYGVRYVMGSNLRIAERMNAAITSIAGGEAVNEWSINERLYYIEKAEELFATSPIWGAGSNGFAAYMKEIGYNHVAYCHNNFWELLSTLGIIGFLIFYYMQFRCLYYGRPWRKNIQNIRPIASALWVLLAINVVFGWWYVYYASVGNNYLLFLTYMACYVNHALPEAKRWHVKPLNDAQREYYTAQ